MRNLREETLKPPEHLPGSAWFAWAREPALRIGVLTGVSLSAVLGTWLVLANHVRWSADFAGIRNEGAAALTLLLMLIPIGRFLRSPARLFLSGLTAWGVFSFTYLAMGLYFERLFSRMGPLHMFMLGAVVYGALAALAWVVQMVWTVRQQSLAVSRPRAF